MGDDAESRWEGVPSAGLTGSRGRRWRGAGAQAVERGRSSLTGEMAERQCPGFATLGAGEYPVRGARQQVLYRTGSIRSEGGPHSTDALFVESIPPSRLIC